MGVYSVHREVGSCLLSPDEHGGFEVSNPALVTRSYRPCLSTRRSDTLAVFHGCDIISSDIGSVLFLGFSGKMVRYDFGTSYVLLFPQVTPNSQYRAIHSQQDLD
jgi:hypothetical protein